MLEHIILLEKALNFWAIIKQKLIGTIICDSGRSKYLMYKHKVYFRSSKIILGNKCFAYH